MTTILVLDDCQAVRAWIAFLAAERGFKVYTAEDSSEAESFLRQAKVDLLIQDIARPGTNGAAFYQQLKSDARLRDIPVLFCAACKLPEPLEKLRQKCGDGYISKPSSSGGIVLAIEDILLKRGKVLPTPEDETKGSARRTIQGWSARTLRMDELRQWEHQRRVKS